ncbi:hypothetical protein MmTuc01_1300 [Methanosarcina mazei Tuc01]|uniref:Uncharacterized protein n=1 Tax=Methanosarcina mazei Tuc01 TaxID=1236903 RepID=M1PWQ8_METMZ|nr:hypothetical protein MmTuc01_1300 [Methanosarcina mazei Tuc01]
MSRASNFLSNLQFELEIIHSSRLHYITLKKIYRVDKY